MEYTLKINDFEGPLDLLLHLIKKTKKNIFDFSIEEITRDYLNFIKQMQDMNLDIASSYLVMASELIEIKSRLLLPSYEDDEDSEYSDDPKKSLVDRLIEYQEYKDLTNEFKVLENERKEIFTKNPSDFNEYKDGTENLNLQLDINDLIDAFKKFLERQHDNIPLNTKVTKKEISVENRIVQIREILHTKRKVNFFELFNVRNKEYVIATFLAVLEMVRKQEMIITQANNFDDITCEAI